MTKTDAKLELAGRLVAIEPGPRLRIDPALSLGARRLRGEVHERLQRAAASLPPDHALLVLDAFRTQSAQFALWNHRLAELARRHADLAPAALSELCRRDVADPVNAPSGHQSGAAVDVTLLLEGAELDMGSAYGDFSSRGTATDLVCTDACALTPCQRANRDALCRAMAAGGFVNYPQEWWHYSWGDRLWAQITAFGHDDASRQSEQVARADYPFVAVIDSPVFEVEG